MTTQRDNVKAGLFVFLGIVLSLVCIFVLSDFNSLFAKTQKVRIYYALSDGLQGLQLGAAVKLGGQPIGDVADIEDFEPTTDATESAGVRGIIVTINIPERVKLYWNARVELSVPPLGTGTALNIADVGRDVALYDSNTPIPMDVYEKAYPEYRATPASSPNISGEPLFILGVPLFTLGEPLFTMKPIPDGAIPGRVAGSSLTKNITRDMGIADAQRVQIKQIIANVAVITTDLKRVSAVLAKNDTSIEKTLTNIEAVSQTLKDDLPEVTASAKRTMAKAEETIGKVGAEVELAIKDARASLADVKAVTADVRERSGAWFDRIDSITKQTDEVINDLKVMVKEQSPVVGEAIANIRDVTKIAKEKTMKQIDEALTKANAAVDNLRDASAEVKTLAVGQRPVLERAFANFELTSAQLKLASIEVRRSPWRLLYEPDDKELETDNLYDAARSFALAAETLDSASKSLQAVVKENPASPQVAGMVKHLETLFTKFKVAEDSFWNALKKAPTVRKP